MNIGYLEQEKMKLTIIDIAQWCNWSDICKSIRYHYGLSKQKADRYEEVFEQLKRYKKTKKGIHRGELLQVTGGSEVWGDDHQFDEAYYCATQQYGLSFRRWQEVASIPIELETLRRYTWTDIIAHFIWEITWYGDEKNMMKQGEEIFKIVKDVEKDIIKKHKNEKDNI